MPTPYLLPVSASWVCPKGTDGRQAIRTRFSERQPDGPQAAGPTASDPVVYSFLAFLRLSREHRASSHEWDGVLAKDSFIKTILREWAYVVPYATSSQRTRALVSWLHRYNWHRRHDSLGGLPPISTVILGTIS